MIFLLFALLFTTPVTSLAVSDIPLELLISADAVVRYDNVKCTVKSKSKLEVEVKKAITILSADGEGAGNVAIYYNDEGDKIKDLSIEIYNKEGSRTSKVKKKEIMDLSVYDGFSIANDARMKYYNHVSNSYPYTIVYSYTKVSKNTLTVPSWYPLKRTKVSVEKCTYELSSQVEGLTFKSKAYNCAEYPITLDFEKNKYSAKNILATKSEKLTPSIYEYLPFVRISPSSFQYFGFDGSYQDWNSYGAWMHANMLKDRGQLPTELIKEIEEILPDAATNEEKARIIYNYVTNSTRYVSVQLGIGGFMPFKCSDVYGLKYGDCKALSYYTQNLLEHFGVEAIYTEIKSDRDYNYSYDVELPGVDQGNHIVLCLPNDGDTLWLECTSSNVPFGYTHSGINSRKALLIKATDSKLVTTSTYTAAENISICNVNLRVDKEDVLSIEIENLHKNLRQERMRPFLKIGESKRDKYIREYYYDQLTKIDIESFEVKLDSLNFVAEENGKFTCSAYIEKAGDYKMIPINVVNYNIPEKLEKNRKYPIYIKDSTSDSILIRTLIPNGMMWVESKTPTITIENEFGIVKSIVSHNTETNSIDYNIFIQHNSRSFPPELLDDYNDFVKAIQTVFLQKTIFKPIK